MTNKLSVLLRKVYLSSLAGTAVSNSIYANNNKIALNQTEANDKVESVLNQKPDLSKKLLLKKTNNDEWLFMSHRSHRSHSSHRSHYSSSSGSSYTPPANRKTSSSSGLSLGPNSNDKTTTTALSLGARTLKRGMSGTDVTELVNILLTKGYLKLDDGGTFVTGIYTFDEIIENALKRFQINNGLEGDGVCGATTIYYLKKK